MPGPRRLQFYQADVFTDQPFGGNPVAVFPDADGLTDVELQQIAREMNLSETVFVFPPTDKAAVVKMRIFTPTQEIPFAGHPVIGTFLCWPPWTVSRFGSLSRGCSRNVISACSLSTSTPAMV